MKTIKNGSEIKRVSDIEAGKLVASGWAYCAKKEWKNKSAKDAKVEKAVEDANVADAAQSIKKSGKTWKRKDMRERQDSKSAEIR